MKTIAFNKLSSFFLTKYVFLKFLKQNRFNLNDFEFESTILPKKG